MYITQIVIKYCVTPTIPCLAATIPIPHHRSMPISPSLQHRYIIASRSEERTLKGRLRYETGLYPWRIQGSSAVGMPCEEGDDI